MMTLDMLDSQTFVLVISHSCVTFFEVATKCLNQEFSQDFGFLAIHLN